jgi:hypothetical protein
MKSKTIIKLSLILLSIITLFLSTVVTILLFKDYKMTQDINTLLEKYHNSEITKQIHHEIKKETVYVNEVLNTDKFENSDTVSYWYVSWSDGGITMGYDTYEIKGSEFDPTSLRKAIIKEHKYDKDGYLNINFAIRISLKQHIKFNKYDD